MRFQVGRFTCEMPLEADGKVQTAWLPEPPKYLNKIERAEYRVGRAAFLEQVGHTSTTLMGVHER